MARGAPPTRVPKTQRMRLGEFEVVKIGARKFDLAELWHQHTGLGFVFAMWMSRRNSVDVDLIAARDEGIQNLPRIARNYAANIGIDEAEMLSYLSTSISYSIDESMQTGMELYFSLAKKHRLIENVRPLNFL